MHAKCCPTPYCANSFRNHCHKGNFQKSVSCTPCIEVHCCFLLFYFFPSFLPNYELSFSKQSLPDECSCMRGLFTSKANVWFQCVLPLLVWIWLDAGGREGIEPQAFGRLEGGESRMINNTLFKPSTPDVLTQHTHTYAHTALSHSPGVHNIQRM